MVTKFCAAARLVINMAAKSCVFLRGIFGRNSGVISGFQCKIGGRNCSKWRHSGVGKYFYCTSSPSKLPKEATEHRNLTVTAVCVERLPRITPDKSDLERQFEDLQNQLELEHSVLSEDELEAARLAQRKKKLKEEDDEESMAIAKEQSQRTEFEDAEEEALKAFRAGSRVTEADRDNDLKSLNRKLQQNLILLVKKKHPEECWEMPCGNIFDSETLTEAAKRGLTEVCGNSLAVQFFSNAPNALYKKPKTDIKVFFYKAQYAAGEVELSGQYTDHVWITKEEMESYVAPDYYKAVRRFIF